MYLFNLILVSLISFSPLFADFDFKLDPAPKNVRKVMESNSFLELKFPVLLDADLKNDLERAIASQTSVKSQGKRGTCSIFSAAAEVESLLKSTHNQEVDLSENFLEHVVMNRIKSFPSEGSDTVWNIPALQRHGAIYETDWPYEVNSWENISELSEEEAKKANATCGSLSGKRKVGCLLSHLDPEDRRYDVKAKSVHQELNLGRLKYFEVNNQTNIKRSLDKSQPLLLGLEFFYGAWNHRKMEDYKIGTRNMIAWEKGVVSTPTQRDIQISRSHAAGHSIVIVGYDDAKRVYYFKNSWGTESFGVKSDLLGQEGTTKGYGSISYDYAHNYGSFYGVGFSN